MALPDRNSVLACAIWSGRNKSSSTGSRSPLAVVIGGSLGGMQALQWAMDAPERVAHAIIIGASDHHTAMGIALNAVQREAIALDPVRGVALARKIAMLSYKSRGSLARAARRKADRKGRAQFDVEGYLDHQGEKFIERMDGATYTLLTHAMDSFDVRNRPAPPGVDLTFVGISSDWLFRPARDSRRSKASARALSRTRKQSRPRRVPRRTRPPPHPPRPRRRIAHLVIPSVERVTRSVTHRSRGTAN